MQSAPGRLSKACLTAATLKAASKPQTDEKMLGTSEEYRRAFAQYATHPSGTATDLDLSLFLLPHTPGPLPRSFSDSTTEVEEDNSRTTTHRKEVNIPSREVTPSRAGTVVDPRE